jgi:hypothetical protein
VNNELDDIEGRLLGNTVGIFLFQGR